MEEEEDSTNSLIVDIQHRTERMDNMLMKLDISIEKLNEISTWLAVHNEKFKSQDKLNDYFYDILEQRKDEVEKNINEITQSLKEIREESHKNQDKNNERFALYQRLIYMSAAGGFVLGFFLPNTSMILSKLIQFLTQAQ